MDPRQATPPRELPPRRAKARVRRRPCRLLLLACAGALAACSLSRSPLEARTDWNPVVQPEHVCAGEPVAASWDTRVLGCISGGFASGCPPEPTVFITSEPAVLTLETRTQRGSMPALVAGDTGFTFSASPASYDRMRYPTVTRSANAIQLLAEERVTRETPGACVGALPSWPGWPLKAGPFRSERVSLVRLCNRGSDALRVTLLPEEPRPDEPPRVGTPSFPLVPGECTPELEPVVLAHVAWAAFDSVGAVDPGTCGATYAGGPLPTLLVEAVVKCAR